MKANHFQPFLLACLTILITAAFSSCNNDRKKLLETVPFDSDAVAAVDLLRLASECQVKIEDGRLVLPPEMSEFKEEISPEISKTIARIAGAIDLKNVIIFGSVSASPVGTARVTDIEELRSLIKKYDGDKVTDASLEAYKVNGSYIVISNDEKQCWLADREKQIAQIEDFEALDAKKSICRYSGVESALMADGIAVYAVNLAAVQTMNENYWVTGKFSVDNNAIVAEAGVIEPDGGAVETDMLQEIDTDFLRYMPSNFIGAFALGINPQSKDYAKMLGEVKKLGVGNDDIFNYVKALDGTVAFGFGPKNKEAFKSASPADWQFLAMAHMNRDKVDALTNLVATQLPGSKEGAKGLYSFKSGQVDVTYGNVDGNFALAFGMPLDSKEENSFATVFEGKRLAGVLQTPLLNTIVNNPRLNYSVKATFELNGSTYVVTLKLVGNDNPIIPTLVKDIPAFFEAFSAAVSAPGFSSLSEPAEPDLEEIIEVETDESFNAHMSGTAGPAKIKSFDFFCSDDGSISGTDMYFDTPLPIEGYYNSSTGEVSITESNGDMVTGSITGRLIRSGNNITITGTFVNYKGKSYSLNLSGSAF